jgi:hypothetical protein
VVRIPVITKGSDTDNDRTVVVPKTDSDRTVERLTPKAPPATPPAAKVTGVATPVTPMARPRASALATLSLILGLGGAFLVLTGVLAPVGVAAGVLGLLFGIAGISATKRRHVAGRFDALLGTVLSLGAVAVGVLALTDLVPWLDPNTNYVARLDDWLVARMPWLDRF